MIQLRHTGLYVKDIEREAEFYRQTFSMYTICEKAVQADALLADLFGQEQARVWITKLITAQGRANGYDDMLELVQVHDAAALTDTQERKIFLPGCMHLAFGVDDMAVTVERVQRYGGSLATGVHEMGNGNQCCFARDPEKNWIEIIGRHAGSRR